MPQDVPKPIAFVPVSPPLDAQRACREARFAEPGERRNRYSLPASLESTSPVGYRVRPSLSEGDVRAALALLAMDRPERFAAPQPIAERELFEEVSLGILSSRQSTNYRGFRQVTLGPGDSETAAGILSGLGGLEAPVLQGASYTHIVLPDMAIPGGESIGIP